MMSCPEWGTWIETSTISRMATIDSPTIIRKFLEHDGIYPGDPRAYAISTYVSAWGKKTYHVAYSHADVISAATSPCIDKLVLLWDRNGLTVAGREELKQMCAGGKG